MCFVPVKTCCTDADCGHNLPRYVGITCFAYMSDIIYNEWTCKSVVDGTHIGVNVSKSCVCVVSSPRLALVNCDGKQKCTLCLTDV